MKCRTFGIAALALTMAVATGARAQEGAGDVVYVPTPQIVVEAMLRMAKVTPTDYVIDLGSGDGRMVITAAKKFGARGFGVDLDEVLLARSNKTAAAEGVADRAQFFNRNLFETDFSQATVITSYLLPEMNEKLRPKIFTLKPGTRVVAHDYHMGEWYPDENDTLSVPEKKVGNPGVSYIYLWYVPANVAGKWVVRLTTDGKTQVVDAEFDQRFQMFEGTAKLTDRAGKIQGGRVRGEGVTFWVASGSGPTATRHEFVGKVSGDAMSGAVRIHGEKGVLKQATFSASRTAPGKMRTSGRDDPVIAAVAR